MQKIPTIPTHQIIIFVVFICAALITSLFLFHLREKPVPQINLGQDVGMIFPVPRDIKSFELTTTNNQKFTQQNLYQHWTLLFFGFTHCLSVCPTTLDVLNRAYRELHKTYPNLQVVLVSLDPDRDAKEILAKYTHSFNSDFIGVSGKIQELRKLQSQLGIFSAREYSSSGNNYQINHTSSILLINPQGQWAGLFKFGLTPKQLSLAFTESVKSFSK